MPAVTALDAKALALAELMTNGSEFAEVIDGKVSIPQHPHGHLVVHVDEEKKS